MSLNKFKLIGDHDDHFELEHPKGEKFKVSKQKLTPVAVQAPELAAFSAPTQPEVQVATPDQVGAGIFTMNRKKEHQEQVPVALPAGA